MSQAKVTALVVVAMLAGFWGGYLYRGQTDTGFTSGKVEAAVPERAQQAPVATMPGAAEHDLQVHMAVLQKDPKNLNVLIQVGNIHYDAQRYQESIQYYTRALQIQPANVDVRTDMGTAYWYSGQAKEAVEQFDIALKTEPNHAQTLFNMGIVKLHGLNDPAGAINAWEALLKANPQYTEAEKVKAEIEQARALLKVKNSTK